MVGLALTRFNGAFPLTTRIPWLLSMAFLVSKTHRVDLVWSTVIDGQRAQGLSPILVSLAHYTSISVRGYSLVRAAIACILDSR